ncbi:MAG: hypothetical protein D6710_01230 [Nitrospirae bacterium]|nr:MAG: hypothetical protein D6710_01230 [Nitrospirota bacterium]
MLKQKNINRLSFRKAHLRSSDEVVSLLRDIRDKKLPRSKKPKDLKNSMLQGADLEGVDLSGVDLSGSDLSGANLKGARLFKANLSGCILKKAILDDAELSGADLSRADMEEVSAINAGFGMAKLVEVNLFEGNLTGATLTMAEIRGANMQCCRLEGARLREAKLLNTDLTNADLRGVDMSLSSVDGSRFTNADLRGARLRQLSGYETADWIGVDLRDINFSGAYLLRRFIMDQNFLKEFRDRNRYTRIIYYLWLVTSDCGRSMTRWCAWTLLFIIGFGLLYSFTGVDYGEHRTWFSPFYYSVVTFTTLGYGDVVPAGVVSQFLAIIEVTIGYVMLGGLLSIFANKMARRAD